MAVERRANAGTRACTVRARPEPALRNLRTHEMLARDDGCVGDRRVVVFGVDAIGVRGSVGGVARELPLEEEVAGPPRAAERRVRLRRCRSADAPRGTRPVARRAGRPLRAPGPTPPSKAFQRSRGPRSPTASLDRRRGRRFESGTVRWATPTRGRRRAASRQRAAPIPRSSRSTWLSRREARPTRSSASIHGSCSRAVDAMRLARPGRWRATW